MMGLELQLFARAAQQRPRPVRHDQVELLLAAGSDLAELWLAGWRAISS